MMNVNISLISARENVGRKTVKTLNLPLRMHALHIIVQENDDQQIKKNIRLKFPEFCQILKFPEFSMQGILLAIFPVFSLPWVPCFNFVSSRTDVCKGLFKKKSSKRL